MTVGIYRLINNRTGEVYVGQSHSVYARRAKHHKELILGTHHNKGLQEDYDSGDTFSFEILEKIPNPTEYELNEREKYYIEKFNSYNEGYNRTLGGEHDEDKGMSGVGGRLPSYKYKPVPKPKLLEKCPECGGELVKRKSKYGNFAGCSNYPKCDFTCFAKEVNFKTKKQPSHVSTKYDPNTYVPLANPGICKSCGKLIRGAHIICPFCKELLIETPHPEQKTHSKTKTKSNKRKPHRTEFEKFCILKYNYLTRKDCNYLARKYNIDIINVYTTKNANNIVRNHLEKTGQWNLAMQDLYKHNNHSTRKDEANKTSTNKSKQYTNVKNTKTVNKHENIKYCTNCGYKIDSKDTYCGNCGKKLDKTVNSNNKTNNTKIIKKIFKKFGFS